MRQAMCLRDSLLPAPYDAGKGAAGAGVQFLLHATREVGKAAGFDWHLTKPIDLDTLCTVLQDRPSAEIGPPESRANYSDQG